MECESQHSPVVCFNINHEKKTHMKQTNCTRREPLKQVTGTDDDLNNKRTRFPTGDQHILRG